jgi:uridine kinase
MRKQVEVVCSNTREKRKIMPGLNLAEIANEFNVRLKTPILGAMVNNTLKELNYEVYSPKTINFIDVSHPAGMQMYQRSLFFVLQKAVKDLVPGSSVRIEHSVSKGFYCEIDGCNQSLELPLIFNINDRMRELIAADIPFRREKVLTKDVVEMFEGFGYYEKAKLFRTRPKLYTSVYYLNDAADYFFGGLVPSTGYLKVFDLVKYYKGMLLRIPKRNKPDEVEDIEIQSKMFEIFQEYKNWIDILGVGSLAAINDQVQKGYSSELIKISEALHEKKVAQIADAIYNLRDKVRVVLISGPSSSGKTTFAKRLSIQLKVSGLKPYTISLDNYFVDREQTPRDEKGEFDFESIKALDVDSFNRDLIKLLDGEEVELPKFSFEQGRRFYDKTFLQMDANGIIIIEGIHALNPELTALIPAEKKYKIYVSALTSLSFDRINRIPTTDNRLIRRIIRDYKYRGYSALDTIRRWESVRRGEDKNIFPYQEHADVMFNSAMLYELSALKSYAEPILYELPSAEPEYSEAVRLLKFLSYFTPIAEKEIPPTSILREFLGGSTFSYK